MTITTTTTDLSESFRRCVESRTAPPDLFTDDVFFDLLPPYWRFQLQGPDAFVAQLAVIAQGRASTVRVLRTVATESGFLTEHEEAVLDGSEVARRVWLCEVCDGRIAEVTCYCNGGWDAELRARHAAEAPMVRP
jgi:hypothetical protein